MSNGFIIERNDYLKKDVRGYFHQFYTGYRKPDNPDFLNVLKNTFNGEQRRDLEAARNKVTEILLADLPKILAERDMVDCLLVCVPRAKALIEYANTQLMFKEAVKNAANGINSAIDGTECICRVVNTFTTHLAKAHTIKNEGDKPYPGITAATCEIDAARIMNQNIILVDDIYTKTINIDEDCIQALYDKGAKEIVFYSIGYTRRNE